MQNAHNKIEALVGLKNWIMEILEQSPEALKYYQNRGEGRTSFEALKWRDYAAIRLLDYIDNAGREFKDLNLRGEIAVSNPIRTIWLAVTYGTGGAKPYFFEDMLQLFRQLRGANKLKLPDKKKVDSWMKRHPSGLDPRIVELREENKERILRAIIKKIDEGKINSERFKFGPGMSKEQKYMTTLEWWNDYVFHLNFAARSPDLLNEFLGNSLDPDTMKILYRAKKAGIPFFVNPYYLSLLDVRVPHFAIGADLAIRDYVIYSNHLVEEFGNIVAWEKEDIVKPGNPNAAGWILPTQHNIHRRYPEVAILIPDTVGRACGGLCASCQRMFDFQNGHLNFDLDKLKPRTAWTNKLEQLMEYFEKDSQLRDILITGGDALMSSDKSLQKILDAVYKMAVRKKNANKTRKKGAMYAELVRVRLGTRIPAHLPQRLTPDLMQILKDFKTKASKIGIKQFVVQTHFESSMEVTPEARDSVKRLIESGWTVTNQHVLTTSSSRRGHVAKSRQDLNEIGVLSYYCFTVKGYMENYHNFATNARAVQEQMEEKVFGRIPKKHYKAIQQLPLKAKNMIENIGEDISEYASIWGYSLGETEPRLSLFEYPAYNFKVTDKMTNLKVE